MTREHEDYLFSTFPNLFPGGRNADERESLMRFGFPGDGWFNILKELCEKITATGIQLKVVQVKEKFGTLRFYVDLIRSENSKEGDNETINKLISEAETKTEVTCEWCGAPATLRQGGWWRVLCDGCETEREKKRADQKW